MLFLKFLTIIVINSKSLNNIASRVVWKLTFYDLMRHFMINMHFHFVIIMERFGKIKFEKKNLWKMWSTIHVLNKDITNNFSYYPLWYCLLMLLLYSHVVTVLFEFYPTQKLLYTNLRLKLTHKKWLLSQVCTNQQIICQSLLDLGKLTTTPGILQINTLKTISIWKSQKVYVLRYIRFE